MGGVRAQSRSAARARPASETLPEPAQCRHLGEGPVTAQPGQEGPKMMCFFVAIIREFDILSQLIILD